MFIQLFQLSKPFFLLILLLNCSSSSKGVATETNQDEGISQNAKKVNDTLVNTKRIYFAKKIIPAANRTSLYIDSIKNKNIALVVNQTSTIGNRHIVDSLLSLGIKINSIFAPEHGFRGNHSAGSHVASGKDKLTGLPIISLYGKHKKPTKADLTGVEYVFLIYKM